jgi:hypothetical protein
MFQTATNYAKLRSFRMLTHCKYLSTIHGENSIATVYLGITFQLIVTIFRIPTCCAMLLHPHCVKDFERDGAVVLRGVLTTMQLMQLEFGIEENLANLSPLAIVASEPDDPGHFLEDFCTWQSNPHYEHILRETALPWIARELMQSSSVRLYHDHLLVKEPGTRQPTPWHQDQPYYNVSGRQNVSFWIPVDPVPLSSSLRFIAGSHDGTWYMPRTFRDAQAKWFPPGTLQELPDIEAGLKSCPPSFTELAWALEPGDCVAFHMLTLLRR